MIDAQIAQLLQRSPVQVEFGAGSVARAGEWAARLGARRVLLVTDRAIRAAGHVERLLRWLHDAFVEVAIFEDVEPNPTTLTVQRGLDVLRGGADRVDLILGLGGGSVMDCAKGVNLLLTCGGAIADFRGDPPLSMLETRPALRPQILIPTTAGTGSEAQSFALLSDAATHMKMACGDRRPPGRGLRPVAAILDPTLTATQPPMVAAATGMDALTHAVETAGCRTRNETSLAFSRAAWELLAASYARAVRDWSDESARAAMLLGAHLAGCAIENSMLGAAHACANPLTAAYDIVHGFAVGLLLPHVVRFNAADGKNPYAALEADAETLAERLTDAGRAAALPARLRDCGVDRARLPDFAVQAAAQWTAGFNPRPVGAAELERIYEAAW